MKINQKNKNNKLFRKNNLEFIYFEKDFKFYKIKISKLNAQRK